MKRLIISSLLGCMLMGQMQASSLITKESAVALAKGAGIALVPLALRGAFVMIDGALTDKQAEHNGKKITASIFEYSKPGTSMAERAIVLGGSTSAYATNVRSGLYKYIVDADNRRIDCNRIAAFLSALLFGGSVAKLLGFLPLYFSEKEAMIGIATGSTLSLLSLARNLTKPSFKIN